MNLFFEFNYLLFTKCLPQITRIASQQWQTKHVLQAQAALQAHFVLLPVNAPQEIAAHTSLTCLLLPLLAHNMHRACPKVLQRELIPCLIRQLTMPSWPRYIPTNIACQASVELPPPVISMPPQALDWPLLQVPQIPSLLMPATWCTLTRKLKWFKSCSPLFWPLSPLSILHEKI